MNSDTDVPQIAYPFEILSNGLVREVEQDSLDEIAMSVEVCLRYPIGFREELPEFGMPELTFRTADSDLVSIIAAHIARWEDRLPILVEERPADWERMSREFAVKLEGGTGA